MKNNYLFILNLDGTRVTSIVETKNMKKDDLIKVAKENYPNKDYVYVIDGDSMLNDFIEGKIYQDGKMVDAPIVEPTALEIKKAAVEGIKSKYNAKFADYETALIRARLTGNDALIAKLQENYKADLVAMAKEIKALG